VSEALEACDWEEKLQDWIDGDLESHQVTLLIDHVASCQSCSALIGALRTLDASLVVQIVQPTPGVKFDRRLLARIAAAEIVVRPIGRARVEKELKDQLTALSHQQRRRWGAAILNALAGAAVVMALARTLSLISFFPRIAHVIGAWPQYPIATPTVALSLAAGFAALAVVIARLLAGLER
jgi:hypothetical protein